MSDRSTSDFVVQVLSGAIVVIVVASTTTVLIAALDAASTDIEEIAARGVALINVLIAAVVGYLAGSTSSSSKRGG